MLYAHVEYVVSLWGGRLTLLPTCENWMGLKPLFHSHLGHDTGNPRVYFGVPAPVPVNTVPLRLRVWYYRGFQRVTRRYSRVLTRICILII